MLSLGSQTAGYEIDELLRPGSDFRIVLKAHADSLDHCLGVVLLDEFDSFLYF